MPIDRNEQETWVSDMLVHTTQVAWFREWFSCGSSGSLVMNDREEWQLLATITAARGDDDRAAHLLDVQQRARGGDDFPR